VVAGIIDALRHPNFKWKGKILETPKKPNVFVRTCPCCGTQVLVRALWKLPNHYDDPNHPISMIPVEQARYLDLEFKWADKK
jgi:hypothetical protein